jgi:hypothetical protein
MLTQSSWLTSLHFTNHYHRLVFPVTVSIALLGNLFQYWKFLSPRLMFSLAGVYLTRHCYATAYNDAGSFAAHASATSGCLQLPPTDVSQLLTADSLTMWTAPLFLKIQLSDGSTREHLILQPLICRFKQPPRLTALKTSFPTVSLFLGKWDASCCAITISKK